MQQNVKLNFCVYASECTEKHTHFRFIPFAAEDVKSLYHLRQVVIVRKSIANMHYSMLLSPIYYTTASLLYLLDFIEFYQINYIRVYHMGLLLLMLLSYGAENKIHLNSLILMYTFKNLCIKST